MIKEFIKKLWQWFKDQTEFDETIEDVKEEIDDVVEEVERRYNRVKEEIEDVKESASEVIKQVDDVAKAAGGSVRKGRKPKKQSISKSNLNTKKTSTKIASRNNKVTKTALREMKKEDLIAKAKKEFKITLDSKLTKSNLVNKVYELYHKK